MIADAGRVCFLVGRSSTLERVPNQSARQGLDLPGSEFVDLLFPSQCMFKIYA